MLSCIPNKLVYKLIYWLCTHIEVYQAALYEATTQGIQNEYVVVLQVGTKGMTMNAYQAKL